MTFWCWSADIQAALFASAYFVLSTGIRERVRRRRHLGGRHFTSVFFPANLGVREKICPRPKRERGLKSAASPTAIVRKRHFCTFFPGPVHPCTAVTAAEIFFHTVAHHPRSRRVHLFHTRATKKFRDEWCKTNFGNWHKKNCIACWDTVQSLPECAENVCNAAACTATQEGVVARRPTGERCERFVSIKRRSRAVLRASAVVLHTLLCQPRRRRTGEPRRLRTLTVTSSAPPQKKNPRLCDKLFVLCDGGRWARVEVSARPAPTLEIVPGMRKSDRARHCIG